MPADTIPVCRGSVLDRDRTATAGLADADDLLHADAAVEEWCFAGWSPRDDLGLVTGYRRRTGGPGWYWAALARAGQPLLHVTEWDVPPRTDPLLVKAHGLWAEHVCEMPMQQWTVANETYAVALEDPDEALGRAYGVPSALAVDLEWYATEAPAADRRRLHAARRGARRRRAARRPAPARGDPGAALEALG